MDKVLGFLHFLRSTARTKVFSNFRAKEFRLGTEFEVFPQGSPLIPPPLKKKRGRIKKATADLKALMLGWYLGSTRNQSAVGHEIATSLTR